MTEPPTPAASDPPPPEPQRELPSNVDELARLGGHRPGGGDPADGASAPPEWGCDEFRRTIGWMRAWWPDLAAEAEHPLLEAMLAARGDRKRLVRIRPTTWYQPRRESFQWAIMQAPLNARQMAAIELGFAAHSVMTAKKPNGGFYDVLYYIGLFQLILALCVLGFFLAFTYPYDMDLDADWVVPLMFMVYGAVGGLVQILAGKRHVVENFKFMQMSFERYRAGVMRAAGMNPSSRDSGKVLLIGCLAVPGAIFLTYGSFFLIPLWMMIAPLVAFVLLLTPKREPDPAKLAGHLAERMPEVERAYDKLRAKLESYAPVE